MVRHEFIVAILREPLRRPFVFAVKVYKAKLSTGVAVEGGFLSLNQSVGHRFSQICHHVILRRQEFLNGAHTLALQGSRVQQHLLL